MKELDSPPFFAEWLQRRRKTLDLTQAELAQRAGCSVFAVRKIETGERRPSKELARLLARSLDVPPEDQEAFVKVARGEFSAEWLVALSPGAGGPTPPCPAGSSDNLPVNLTPFVGREQESAALGRLLQDPLCRLLTLIGAGGIGKTRLAIEVASRHRHLFADGVCFVPLAPVSSPTFLIPAIADALGFAFQGQIEPRLQLLSYLRPKQILLILDNAEHLMDGVELFTRILERAPHVKLLVTSRQRLNLQCEWVFVVQGLPVPPPDQLEHAEAYNAVQLFVQSARRARASFELRGEERAAVVRICQMVEGMPLGIELAAAWTSMLDCSEIAQEIERSLDFLAMPLRDVPDRQRSLRAVFDHSWNLLSAEERGVLSRLAIFQGGFGRDAAEQIAGANLRLLHALVSKSLLRYNEGGRYDLHEVVRQYALARFANDPDCELARDKHSHFYLSLLRDSEEALKGAAQRETIRDLKAELDNMRVAWTWAIRREQFALIGQALRSFGWLCNIGVLYREGIEQLESLVQALRLRPGNGLRQSVLGKALAQQALLYFRRGQFDQALSVNAESLALLRPLNDPGLLPDSLVIRGILMHLTGEFDQAQALEEEGFACAQAAGDRSFTAYALFNLGYIARLKGHYEEGYEQMLAGLALWRELGDPSATALGLNYISPTAIYLGQLEEAEAFLQESLSLLTEVGDRWGMGTAYRLLGLAALVRGAPGEAQSLIRRSLELFSGFITGWDVLQSLIYLGMATAATGDSAEAQQVFLEALHLAKAVHAAPLTLDIFLALAQLHMHAANVEEALALTLFVMGHPARTQEMKERAGRLYAEAEAQLAPEQICSAIDWAANHSLETIVESLLASI